MKTRRAFANVESEQSPNLSDSPFDPSSWSARRLAGRECVPGVVLGKVRPGLGQPRVSHSRHARNATLGGSVIYLETDAANPMAVDDIGSKVSNGLLYGETVAVSSVQSERNCRPVRNLDEVPFDLQAPL